MFFTLFAGNGNLPCRGREPSELRAQQQLTGSLQPNAANQRLAKRPQNKKVRDMRSKNLAAIATTYGKEHAS